MHIVDTEIENYPMEIGKDWFVYNANLDSDEPFIVLAHKEGGIEKKMPIPEPLAYYLRTHWCGSQIMHDLIEKKVKESVDISELYVQEIFNKVNPPKQEEIASKKIKSILVEKKTEKKDSELITSDLFNVYEKYILKEQK